MIRAILTGMAMVGAHVTPALAHIGVGETTSFSFGLAHPLTGPDHILAMVAVGLWGVLAGNRAIWVWPMAFLTAMLFGFAAARFGLILPLVEPAILSSIIVVGLLVAFAVNAPLWLGAVIVALFAFFHGHAHGTEVATANLIPYATGFATATSGLLAGGISLGLFVEGSIGRSGLRAAGMLTVLGGLTLLAS